LAENESQSNGPSPNFRSDNWSVLASTCKRHDDRELLSFDDERFNVRTTTFADIRHSIMYYCTYVHIIF